MVIETMRLMKMRRNAVTPGNNKRWRAISVTDDKNFFPRATSCQGTRHEPVTDHWYRTGCITLDVYKKKASSFVI